MARLSRSTAAGLLSIVLCLGMSAGPALADPVATPAAGMTEISPIPGTSPPVEAPVVTAPAPTPAEPEPAAPEPAGPEPADPQPAAPQPAAPQPAAPQPEPASPTPAPSSEVVAPELADLKLRVWFDKPSYRADEDIRVHAAVTNAGIVTANKVVLDTTGNLDYSWWPPFHLFGVTVEPGQTVEGTTTPGRLSTDDGTLRLVVTVRQYDGEADANPEDNTVTVSVPVVITRGDFRATLYGDRDGDQVMDPGEALSGVTFLISGGSPHVTRSATTDAAGVLEFRGLPAGSYYTQVSWIGSGWFVPLWSGQVGGGHDPDVLLRAIPELGDRFAVSLAFTQPEYRSDDIPRALLTLRNTGTVLLTDLAADCGDADVGELTPNGPGVVLRPGETRVFTVTKAPTTNWEAQRGHLWMQCRVGAPLLHQDTTANAVTRIIAPWAPRVVGRLWAQTSVPPLGPPSGYPLPGVKIYLRDQIDGAIVARAVTNANGDFTFLNVRPGPYGVGVVGPWKGGYNSSMVVMAGENGSPSHDVYVVPGPNQPDPDPESSPLPPPPPAGGGGGSTSPPPVTGKPVLAATGANVTWLAFGGLLSLIAGALLVLRARPARQ